MMINDDDLLLTRDQFQEDRVLCRIVPAALNFIGLTCAWVSLWGWNMILTIAAECSMALTFTSATE